MAKDWKAGILWGKESSLYGKTRACKNRIEQLSRELLKHQDLYYKELNPNLRLGVRPDDRSSQNP